MLLFFAQEVPCPCVLRIAIEYVFSSAMKNTQLVLLTFTAFLLAQAQPVAGPNDWPMYGREPNGGRHSPLKQITPANVAGLKRAWTFHAGGTANEATPVVVGGVMYLTSPTAVWALEPETGKQRSACQPSAFGFQRVAAVGRAAYNRLSLDRPSARSCPWTAIRFDCSEISAGPARL